jgi:hypothetical protein
VVRNPAVHLGVFAAIAVLLLYLLLVNCQVCCLLQTDSNNACRCRRKKRVTMDGMTGQGQTIRVDIADHREQLSSLF